MCALDGNVYLYFSRCEGSAFGDMCVCTVPTCNEYLNVHACVRECAYVCVSAGSKCRIQHSSFGLGVVTPSLHLLYIVMCVFIV